MGHEYDFGAGGKVSLTSRTTEHRDMFDALATLGEPGAKIAHYINELKMRIRRDTATIFALKAIAPPSAREIRPEPSEPRSGRITRASHTPGPWKMRRSGMIAAGSDWICSVSGRNRIHNGPLIEAAPDMLEMLERMLSKPSPDEARRIIADATALVETAKRPAWEPLQ